MSENFKEAAMQQAGRVPSSDCRWNQWWQGKQLKDKNETVWCVRVYSEDIALLVENLVMISGKWKWIKYKMRGISLLVQWLRIHLLMQGIQIQSLVREDPTCYKATKPVGHNCWTHTLQLRHAAKNKSMNIF